MALFSFLDKWGIQADDPSPTLTEEQLVNHNEHIDRGRVSTEWHEQILNDDITFEDIGRMPMGQAYEIMRGIVATRMGSRSSAQHDFMYKFDSIFGEDMSMPPVQPPLPERTPPRWRGDVNRSTEGHMEPVTIDEIALDVPMPNHTHSATPIASYSKKPKDYSGLVYRILRTIIDEVHDDLVDQSRIISGIPRNESGIRDFGDEIRDHIEDHIHKYLDWHRKTYHISEGGVVTERNKNVKEMVG